MLAETTRTDLRTGRELVESRHAGHVAVVDAAGRLVASLGDPDRVTFVRSAVKPFQAAACLELLGAQAGELTPEEVAVAWSSHRGEAAQLAAVGRLLERAGVGPEDLTCPPARPRAAPGRGEARLHHNCSGKHALFALAGRAVGCPRECLLDPGGPLQRRVLSLLEEVLGPPRAVAADGCGAPAVAVPLAALAGAFVVLLRSPRFERVLAAGLAHPGLVGGAGRLETALLGAGVAAKPGAEGVFAAAGVTRAAPSRESAPDAFGIALKCEDGAGRGAGAALYGLLVERGVVAEGTWDAPPVRGGGRRVGRVRPATAVRALGRDRTRW